MVGLTTFFSIFVFAPLGIFRLTRSFAGGALVFASYVFGLILWVYGAIATFLYWGWLGLIIGLVIVGVGVVPMGFLALALRFQWEWLANLGLLLASMVGSRLLGLWYIARQTGSIAGASLLACSLRPWPPSPAADMAGAALCDALPMPPRRAREARGPLLFDCYYRPCNHLFD